MAKAPKQSKEDKEESKAAAAAEAAAKRNRKKGKGKDFKYTAAMAGVIGACVLGMILALSGPSAKKSGGSSRLDTYVNDRYTISDATAKAEGNFTAAASPFFNKWTLADVKWGHAGISLSGMLGMPGAVQVCESDEGLEGGVVPPRYDARENHASCFQEVYDSGNCSSSYAIAAAESLSQRFCIADTEKYSTLKLSPQQILSCDKKSRGCKGGGVDSVFAYIQRRGLYPEECLPYAGPKAAQCKTGCEESKKLKMIEHCVLTKEKAVKREIFNRGPVVAPVYLKSDYLVYKDGVYSPTPDSEPLYDQDGQPLMHAVTVLGWGKSQGTPYWIVRHSYGSSWGENGYARIGIDTIMRSSYVVVGVPGTDEALAAQEQKKQEEEKRKEERKIERAARDERIKAQREQMEAEKKAEKEATDLKEMDEDDDFEAEVDLDDEIET